ncbi:hypothetical protein BKA59DRAFT_471454 [Fusarium tricinctum]|uniref:DUF6594 domain-containing protein n=1 Tax=Fusarium tricinctum TaxID=61284 RepID=A0A8K0S248_9HYPO|nr:hypothetical protein BKA59DRAFT_471454 [Fusarium tricinctum]
MVSLQQPESLAAQFPRHWEASTADSNLTLHGFRRFKTTHLLNLRFLEAEIAEIDLLIYQVGLSLNLEADSTDRLGLKYCQKYDNIPSIDTAITKDLIQRLRGLLKEYDEAIIAFNSIMSMETLSLLDDSKQANLRTELTLYEKYNTRLLRVDQGPRARQDPLQRHVHKLLRLFRYKMIARTHPDDEEGNISTRISPKWSSQNNALIADITARTIAAIVTGIFLTVPLVALSYEPRKTVQLAVVSVFVIVFACLVTVMLKASNLEMMVVSAAYAAILSVFVSNNAVSE